MEFTVIIAIALSGVVNAATVASMHEGSSATKLKELAQGFANDAYSAAASQYAAAQQASYVAKNTLAQTASAAAAAAQATLFAKKVLLDSLEVQKEEAHHILEAELEHLHLSQSLLDVAREVVQQINGHIATLRIALNSAERIHEYARSMANKATSAQASQIAMVKKAKIRLYSIEEQLKYAQLTFEATKQATHKATSAAEEAQKNANIARDYANNTPNELSNQQSSNGDNDGSATADGTTSSR